MFAVADDGYPTLRVLFEAFTFARHVCRTSSVQRIVVVLNQRVLLAGVGGGRRGIRARALGDETGSAHRRLAGGDERTSQCTRNSVVMTTEERSELMAAPSRMVFGSS